MSLQPLLHGDRPAHWRDAVFSEIDGHTFLVGPDTMFTVNPQRYRKRTVKPAEDLIAMAKKQPMNCASGGPGVPGHLAMEMLLASTGATMTHVPYRGTAPATQDVVGGAVPCGFLATPVVGPFVRDGRLVALAVSGNRRTESMPAVPTVAETGVRAYVNECPHVHIRLNFADGVFCLYQVDGRRDLMCAHHTAMIRLDDGLCWDGPCRGERLHTVDVAVDRDDMVRVA